MCMLSPALTAYILSSFHTFEDLCNLSSQHMYETFSEQNSLHPTIIQRFAGSLQQELIVGNVKCYVL